MFLLQWWKKVRYIRNSLRDSQYKSEENTELYVHIVTSWLHLIYITCGCYMWGFFFVTISLIPEYMEGYSLKKNFTFCKAIFTRESALVVLRPIEIISIYLFNLFVNKNIKKIGHRGTKSHCVKPWQCFYCL